MKTRIVPMGNSQGIRIPKLLLRKTRLKDEVEIRVQGGSLVIQAVAAPRTGWSEAFRKMAKRGDDELLDDDVVSNQWDEDEWEWQ